MHGEGTVGPRPDQPEPTKPLVIGTIARFPVAVVVTAIGGITRRERTNPDRGAQLCVGRSEGALRFGGRDQVATEAERNELVRS